MTDDSTLPDLNLTDSQVERGTWKPADGWNGLVPGASTLDDAVARLGRPVSANKLANADCYDFEAGAVRVTVLHNETTVFKIRVSSQFGKQALVPRTLDEATKRFGTLKATKIEKTAGVIYERPGMRMAVEDSTMPRLVRWVEFFRPHG